MSVPSVADQLAAAGCVFAEAEAQLLVEAAGSAEELSTMVARRASGVPLEHVIGWTEFHGLRIEVGAGVFVPRVRSGLLVEEAASLARCAAGSSRRAVIADLCCGAGAIGVAIAAAAPRVELHAADIDPRAVACAERNLAAYGGRVHRGDLFGALPRRLRRRIDVVVASPPYVPTAEIRLLTAEARDFEPVVALDGGVEGLDLVDRIARGARRWLAPGGHVAVEVGASQLGRAASRFTECGYASRAVTSEEYGSAVVVGRWLR